MYVLGGSTSREFFYDDQRMSRIVGHPFVNLGSSSQSLIDSLRLIDNIKSKNATVIYCLYPMKFMRFLSTEPEDSLYLMGAYLKYPVLSPAVESLLADVDPRTWSTALVAELNVYCYLLKNYFFHKNLMLQRKFTSSIDIPFKVLFLDNRPPIQHFYHKQAYDRNLLRLELFKIKKKIGQNLEANLKINFHLLDRFIDIAQQHSHQIRILELPYSYTFERMFERELKIYQQQLNVFLQKHPRIPFKRIDFNVYRGKEELFYDHGHLLDKGRDYFYPFIKELIEEDINIAARN
jgi:hypothetical protein